MTRTYALKRLLEHGPMNRIEIIEVMGGSETSASYAIESLVKHRIARRIKYEWAQAKGKCVKSPVYGLVNA